MVLKSRIFSREKDLTRVVPAGTEVTRQGASDHGSRGVVMVVKPVARAYILSGHMMSNTAFGDWLLRRKWPTLLAIFSALLLHTLDFSGISYTHAEVPGVASLVPILHPTATSTCMSLVSVFCFAVAILAVLTRVHSQLLWMSLRTFDPWAIIACGFRGWAARTFSRYWLHQSEENPHWHQSTAPYIISYITDLIIIVECCALLILAEAADIPKVVKKIFVALALLYSSVITAVALMWKTMPDWDPDAEIELFFFATMAPKSQFISAYGTMAIFLLKAAFSTIAQKNAFMYLRCHYEYCTDQLDASFAKLAITDPDVIYYVDFRAALQEIGISESHIWAGYHLLDVEQAGQVRLADFRKALMDIFSEFPDASHTSLLGKYCQEAFQRASGYSSLDGMFGTVFSQWRRMKIEEFGDSMYQTITQDTGLAKIFHKNKMRTQSLLFAAFVQVALGWLEEKNFRKLDRDLISLGLRHRSYGIEPFHICLFQIALLETLNATLNGLSLQAEISWSVVWSHFIVAPFLEGLVNLEHERGSTSNKVKRLLLQVQQSDIYLDTLVKHLRGVVGGFWNHSKMFRDEAHELAHLQMLTGFLIQIADDLSHGRMLKAKQTIRGIAQIHWDRGVVPRHMLAFQHAMLHTLQDVLGPEACNAEHQSSWAVFMQTEVMEVLLLAPFAETQDRVEAWAGNMQSQDVDEKAWRELATLALLNEPLSERGYHRLRLETGKLELSVHDVIKTFCDESMQHPSWTFERVIEHYCRTAPAAESFLE